MSSTLSFQAKGGAPRSLRSSLASFTSLRCIYRLVDGQHKVSRRPRLPLWALALVSLLATLLAAPSHALDLVGFVGITGPLVAALTQLAALGPGVKALVGFIGFVVAFISLSALRNFGPVLFYLGMAIFGAVGLTIAGAIMGAVI